MRLLTTCILTVLVLACHAGADDAPTKQNGIGMKLVRIPAGRFVMGRSVLEVPAKLGGPSLNTYGDADEDPSHEVAISREFLMSQTEVTADQYRLFDPSYAGSGPVTNIRYEDAVAFCNWLSKKENGHYRLPTEAEWEYACRAGTRTPFYSGSKPPSRGEANAWGLLGMHSAPPEWCSDWYGDYSAAKATDPVGAANGFSRVVRGGGVGMGQGHDVAYTAPYYARSANRGGLPPSYPPSSKTGIAAPALVGERFSDFIQQEPAGPIVIDTLEKEWYPTSEGPWGFYVKGTFTLPQPGDYEMVLESSARLMVLVNGRTVHTTPADGGTERLTLKFPDATAQTLGLRFQSRQPGGRIAISLAPTGGTLEIMPISLFESVQWPIPPVPDSRHGVGFRVVLGPPPATAPTPFEPLFITRCVRELTADLAAQPVADKPWMRVRHVLPVPADNDQYDTGRILGFPAGFRPHNHSPALTVLPNGDLLAVYASSPTSQTRYWPDSGFIATRLRFGSATWDRPEVILDVPDLAEGAPLLATFDNTTYLMTGGVGMQGTPFKFMVSADNGASWTWLRFPIILGSRGSYAAEPGTAAWKTADGRLVFAANGRNAGSFLWTTRDGVYWTEAGARSRAVDTAFVPLSDTRLLAVGGSRSSVGGYMPLATMSLDGSGFESIRSGFAALGIHQRPAAIRLQSGRILVASDFQDSTGAAAAGIISRGVMLAWSDDQGASWALKTLELAEPFESAAMGAIRRQPWAAKRHPHDTIGEAVMVQAPNGLIHLLTSMNHPNLHVEFNESWLTSDLQTETPPRAITGRPVSRREFYPGDIPKADYAGIVTYDGHFVLNGKEQWRYQNGQVQYQAEYINGRKVGTESYWDEAGKLVWQVSYSPDGRSTWIQFTADGQTKSQSNWRGVFAHGEATYRAADGTLQPPMTFANGVPVTTE